MRSEYIYIFEDGSTKVGGEPAIADLQACDLGVLTIIKVATLLEYFDGEWSPIERMDS